MSYAGLGQMTRYEMTAGERLGADRTRQPYPTDARFWISDARWAQRAVNAARARSGGELIYVDGRAGPITIGALRALGPGLPPAENYPTGERVTSRVLIAQALADRLAANPPVPDPPRPRTSSTSTTTRPSTSPGAGPGTTAMQTPEGEGSSGWRAWLVPGLVVGAITIAGIGTVFMIQRRRQAVAANRRRGRRRRSSRR